MNYYLYIKSHSEAPDFEDDVVANNLNEAYKKFVERTSWLYDWNDADIIKRIRGEYFDARYYRMIKTGSLKVPASSNLPFVNVHGPKSKDGNLMVDLEVNEKDLEIISEVHRILLINERLDVKALMHFFKKDRETLLLNVSLVKLRIKKALKKHEKN